MNVDEPTRQRFPVGRLFDAAHRTGIGRWVLGSWTAVVLLFLYLPIALLIVFSFNASSSIVVWKGFSVRPYAELAGNIALWRAAGNSLIIGLATTAISVVLGTGGGWLLYRYRYRASGLIGTAVVVPMIVPEVIMGISLLAFFAVAGFELGFVTVIIGHVTFCFPFVLVAVRARLAGLDPALEEAAMDLGATPLQAFFKVIVPYLMPAIVSGALMAFTLSLDELIVTYFTASADSRTLPLVIYGMARKGLSPVLNAVSTVFILGTVLMVLLAEALKRLHR